MEDPSYLPRVQSNGRLFSELVHRPRLLRLDAASNFIIVRLTLYPFTIHVPISPFQMCDLVLTHPGNLQKKDAYAACFTLSSLAPAVILAVSVHTCHGGREEGSATPTLTPTIFQPVRLSTCFQARACHARFYSFLKC